jgi:hypothetical protein
MTPVECVGLDQEDSPLSAPFTEVLEDDREHPSPEGCDPAGELKTKGPGCSLVSRMQQCFGE